MVCLLTGWYKIDVIVTRSGIRPEATMRHAWIGLLLLLAGCAGYLPPATGHPAPSTFD